MSSTSSVGAAAVVVFGLLSSICSAFVGVLFVFEGAFEFASISSYLISGGLWFSGLAGQPQKAKDNGYYEYSRSSSLQVSVSVIANIDDPFVKGSGGHGIVSSLSEGLGQASGRVPRSERQPQLKVLFVPGQVVWMRLGWPGPGRAKFNFFLKDYDGCTRVIKCHDCDLIHDVVVWYSSESGCL